MKKLIGVAASPGLATGPAFRYHSAEIVIEKRRADDPQEEWARYRAAADQALQELAALRDKTAAAVGEGEAAIFDAHQMIIRDPDLDEGLKAELDRGASAEAAVEFVFTREVELFEGMDDPYFRERSSDFTDVMRRVLRLLLDLPDSSLAELDQPAVVVAEDLLPSDTAQMDKKLVRGFCTAGGGPLSHTAILARNLGLPAVVGIGAKLGRIAGGDSLVVDGSAGHVLIDLSEQEMAAYERRIEIRAGKVAEARRSAHLPAVTRDDRRVAVGANIGLPGEETLAFSEGAEGVGLLRTEFLFASRENAPSEDEQYQVYRRILSAAGDRPVIARTLDIGGDKPVPFLAIPNEDNPFLGWRAIRICLDKPYLLRTQLRALLRAGKGTNLSIMVPMVATVGEVVAVREQVAAVQAELRAEGKPAAEEVELGTMIEVPAAAVMADLLAEHVDFFSIGSNDLTQYTVAADRGNPYVAAFCDSLQPAVLRLVDMTIRAGHAAGIWVGLCGELAGDQLAIPVLLGLGLDEFSMGAAAIPTAKALIRQLSLAECQALAETALTQASAADVRSLVEDWLAERGLSPM